MTLFIETLTTLLAIIDPLEARPSSSRAALRSYQETPNNVDNAFCHNHASICPRAAAVGERMLQHGEAGPTERCWDVAGRHRQLDRNHRGRRGRREGLADFPREFLSVPAGRRGNR